MAGVKSTDINNAIKIAQVFAYIISSLGIIALIVIALYWRAYPSKSELEAKESIEKMYSQMADPKSDFNRTFTNEVASKMQASIQKVIELKNKALLKGNTPVQPIDGPFGNTNDPLKEIKDNVLPVINAIKEKVYKFDTLLASKPGSVNESLSSKSDLETLKNSFTAVNKKLSDVEDLVRSYTPKQDTGTSKGKTSDVDLGILKTALTSELGKIVDKVDSNIKQWNSKIENLNKILMAQQDVKKESKYQPVYIIVLSKGFRPKQEAIGFIVKKLSTPDFSATSKASPTVLLSADGNRQGVLSMVGFNRVNLYAWLRDSNYREFKPQIDALPLIVSDKVNSGGQPQHMVVLVGHNVQLDKTKDLSAWEKLENLTFVVIEPPNLGNFSWENLRKIKDVREAKGLKTEIRIFKTANEMDDGFELEIDEIDDIAALMKASVAQ